MESSLNTPYVPYLPCNATAEEARNAAGQGLHAWGRFLLLTRAEARAINKAHPTWTWVDVPPSQKKEVHERLNIKLQKEGVKEIGDDVLRWRMSQALRDARLKKNLKSRIPPEDSPPVVQPRTKMFDPVRDV
ncbi:hypothetical protein B0J11DRAFT_519500 [Dendryphion nanum]|uniref:Uncharacterized protein n=1 Tax=Dendryphion nanum TaxID=256645 RepID=A0A9P9EG03_9PLEO|nr:hypothetical protein B0J11DRAFT_519500 [Dendryphion nanum]